jgi:phytoene dehydrogenase-like protein
MLPFFGIEGASMIYDAIVVGGGIAGLTSAAFLAKAGHSVLLCEKENACGGLLNSFERDGFFFDGGIRATENSGVLFPMLKKLGLDIEFVRNKISVGIEDRVIRINDEGAVLAYQALLNDLYPENRQEISAIIAQIGKIMEYMEVQYGIDNPVFLDIKEDRDYFIKAILPWMVKYAITAPKISKLQEPVVDFLRRYTQNQSLLDIICQHFFQKTPAFFALSYIKLYLEYKYPLGGIGRIVEKMVAFIEDHHGIIHTNTEIVSIDPARKTVTDSHGGSHEYLRLIWAADQKALYRYLDLESLANPRVRTAISGRRALIADKIGNDSVFTLFLALDLDPGYFAGIASEHFFYTPSRIGQTAAGPVPADGDRTTIEKWLEHFFALTTYEISCPVMRDSSLAPAGKTGLIVSVLFDYRLTKRIEEQGWYEEFKAFCETLIIKNMDASIYPGIQQAVLQRFSSTPVTLAKLAGNTDGAIVGWAFNNHPMPAETRIPKILRAVRTPIPGILQAGQWTYSPAGLPISILTGKIAADQVIKEIKKARSGT